MGIKAASRLTGRLYAGALGSANFDVTAAYWESELMLVVEDATIARRVNPQDPGRRRRAEQRRWMRYWPGTLSI